MSRPSPRHLARIAAAPLALAALGCAPEPAAPQAADPPVDPPLATDTLQRPVVYGADDRTDGYAVAQPLWRNRLVQSTVALVPRSNVSVDADTGAVQLAGQVYGEYFDLCAGQRFFDQRRVARCSGTLIAPDLVLTAGHCVPGPNRCADRRFVFNWRMTDAGTEAPLTADDVYRCAEILVSRDDERHGQQVDFAVIRLDRPVVGDRVPAPLLRKDAPLDTGSALNLLGFPNGLPAKFAPDGAVVNARADRLDFFEGSVDAFGGNSGSGVYDAEGRLVGVLVRGATDYTTTPEGCDVVNVLPAERTPEEGAEDITYVARALEGLCATGHDDATLCPPGEGAHCAPCVADADCADGFACVEQPEAPAVGVCALGCRVDADCRPDHRCAEAHCVPRVDLACVGGDVVQQSACGPVLAVTRRCPSGTRCADNACAPAPLGDRCADAIAIEAVDQRLTGDPGAQGHTDLERATCGGEGPDVVFAFGTVAPMDFEAVALGYDTVLSLRRGCEGEELACVDDSDPPGSRGSRVALSPLPAGDYRLILDAYDEDTGTFELDVRFGPAACEGACVPGTASCADPTTRVSCVTDAAGCGQPGAPDGCVAGATCEAGTCIAPVADAGIEDAGVADTGPHDGSVADRGADDVGPIADADSARPDTGADGAPEAPDRGRADLSGDAQARDARIAADASVDTGSPADAATHRGGGSGGCAQGPGAPAAPAFWLLGLLGCVSRRRRRR